jgi:hypothetical protein
MYMYCSLVVAAAAVGRVGEVLAELYPAASLAAVANASIVQQPLLTVTLTDVTDFLHKLSLLQVPAWGEHPDGPGNDAVNAFEEELLGFNFVRLGTTNSSTTH